MKIAVWHNLPSGGGKRALYNHVKGLVERGHSVEAWCPATTDQTFLPLSEVISEHALPFDWEPIKSSNRILRHTTTYRNIVSKLHAMDQHCRQCANQINAGNFDLVFANSCMFFRVAPIGRYVKTRRVLYLQEPYRWLYESLPRLPWLARPPMHAWYSPHYLKEFVYDLLQVQGPRIQAREERLNAEAFDRILVNSHYSRESILRSYGLDATVCYLGVDAEKYIDRHKPREGFVLGIGAFVPEKNIEFVLEAVSNISNSHPKLLWVGNVASQSYLEELKRLAVSKDVCFESRIRVDDEELVSLLNRASVLAYAPRLEPFGYAALEALACGLPVVAVAEGGVRETVIDGVNGFLVENNPGAMAEAIERILSNPQLAKQLGVSGQNLVSERWSIAASIDRLEKQFNEVIETRTPPSRYR